MADLKNERGMSEMPLEEATEVAADKETLEETPEVGGDSDPLASLNKLLEANPEFKKFFETAENLLGGDEEDEEVEVECIEIDGHDYIIHKQMEIAGNTYWHLVNVNDVMDFIIRKIVIKDGKEYMTRLDSEQEFDLVQACLQRDLLMQLREKLNPDGDTSEEDPTDNE